MNPPQPVPPASGTTRVRITVRGAVQGVGFRPFVYRLASELGLRGWVNNSAQGVLIEAEGAAPVVDQFLLRLERERPPRSFIQSLETVHLDAAGFDRFEIRPSDEGGEKSALVLPDIATCPDCRRELFDPANRRFRYPFTNCTNCGPRFSIIEALPYDRPNTSMRRFTMCPACQAEYDDPRDRRFHAQPNACPACGPRLQFWDARGDCLAVDDPALAKAIAALRRGAVVAIKGLGGFQLLVLACNEDAVRRLRARKQREEKPFALMFPSLAAVEAVCEVSALERRLLESPEAPIVLLRRREPAALPPSAAAGAGTDRSGQSPAAGSWMPAESVAPGNPTLGVMLPYTPLHHLLLADLGQPVVATSGNLSDEPICIDEREALSRLAGIADGFLVHDRPIVRHVDDSIARVVLGRELVLRRARGYAPLPVCVPQPLPPTLAVGAHLKNTVAIARGRHVFLSQHIGDLETAAALGAFKRAIDDLQRLYETAPQLVVADAHPDYLSSRHAAKLGLPRLCVQHHHAHVLAGMAENSVSPPCLGVSWDGTGFGLDHTVWGGEFLRVSDGTVERVAHLRRFRLAGGDRAVREPRRAALGLCFELFGEGAFGRADLAPLLTAFTAAELKTLRRMLTRDLNSPWTSSAGRLFDAMASLVLARHISRFEGQAAMELEFALPRAAAEAGAYPIRLEEAAAPVEPATSASPAATGHPDPRQVGRGLSRASGPGHAKETTSMARPDFDPGPMTQLPVVQAARVAVVDWAPLVEAVLADLSRAEPVGRIAARFHNGLAECIVAVARRVGEPKVVLSGGCFQNRYLLEQSVERLRDAGFRAYWHQRVPPNDGGIALGQAVAAGWGR